MRFVLALGGCVVGASASASGAEPERWTTQAGTLFRHNPAPGTSTGNGIAQDGPGFLWLGTQTGLLRWDGYVFRKYASDPNVAGSLPDSYVLCVHADERGRLWVGTSAGGLARLDAARDVFVVYAPGPHGLKAGNVSSIAGDGHGGLWIGTRGGLDHLDANDVLQPSNAAADAELALPNGGIQSLLNDRGGALWAGTQHGLFRRAPGRHTFAEVPLDLPDGTAAQITQVYQDRAGRVWVGTHGHGAFVVDIDGRSARPVRESTPLSALSSDTVLDITEAVPGEIWLATYGGGIVVVGADGATRRIRHQAGIATSLGDDEVLALYRDRSGLVWAATIDSFSLHDPRRRSVLTLHSDLARPQSLRNGNVSAVLARPDGRLWLGVGSEGVDILDPLRGRIGELRADGAHPRSALPKARVLSMVPAPGGEVYIGTRSGLYRSDASGQRVERLEILGRDATAPVWSLCIDGGVLWLGGLDGLWSLERGPTGQLRVLRHDTASQLGAERVVALQRGSGNGLWVGTEHGLVVVDTATGAIERIPEATADPVRLPVGWVSSMLVDARGRLWLSSYGNGVLRFEGRDADGQLRFRRLGSRDGLPDLGVNKLLEAADGRLWASTDNGLAVIDTESFTARQLQRPQGVDLLAYWTNAGARTSTGELVFGGQGGVSVVRPDRLTLEAQRAPVVVTAAHVGASAVGSGRFGGPSGSARPLELLPEARGFWFEFSALDYSAPERNRYAYRLQGFDADWTLTDATHRLASYTNLPPGDYLLELRGSNRDGVWTEPPLALPIRVLPAWYQTVWFRGGAGVVAVLLVAALVQGRTLYLRRRQRELEALVEQRTADLRLRSEELHESQRQLEKIAYADPLTGLPNRRLFSDEMRRQVAQAQRGGPPFALLLIDLDGFKQVNDTQGHDAGDALLVAVAARLLETVREADCVARLGGDEFAVLLTQDPAVDDVDSICRRIIASLSESVSFQGATLQVSASIGVTTFPGQDAAPDRVFKSADLALYDAKRAGRNTWRWHARDDRAVARG